MKKTSRILTVLALAASSVLFATPSHAAPSTQWAYVVAPNQIFVKSITGLSVGMTAKGYPVIAGNIISGNTSTTITAIGSLSTVTTAYGLGTTQGGCDYFNFSNTTRKVCTKFAVGDQGYVLTLSPIGFAQPQELEVGFDGGLAGGSEASSSSTVTRVRGNVKATLDSVTFTDDGTGTAGTLTWKGTNIDSVLYTGPANNYPKAFNYGVYTSSWNGALKDLTPNTTYTFDLYVNSIDDYPAMKTVTFKTGAAPAAVATKDSAYWTKFVDTYVIYAWEAANMKTLMSKFDAIATSPYRAFVKVPTSRVSTWSVTSLTPNACRAETNGVVWGLTGDTCSISYTISGPSKAPVTLVKDLKFTKFYAN